jgi:hypothetical protein
MNENGTTAATTRQAQALVPADAGGAMTPAGRPEIAKALAAAQQKCRAVEKDSWNAFHRYHYASAEAVIAEAKGALAESGLSLLPLEQTIDGYERTGEGRFELRRRFVLMHSSGEWLPLNVAWPVVPEKGRPLDKAAAIAATQSLAYLLRDLLLMPRVDPEDDLPGRQDRNHPQPAAQPAPAQEQPAPKASSATAPADSEGILPEQEDRLAALMGELNIDVHQLAQWLVKAFGSGDWHRLTAEQADRVISGLEARKAKEAAVEAADKRAERLRT